MGCGKKRACTGESISVWSARPSSSTAMAASPRSGERSRCRGTPKRFLLRRRRSKERLFGRRAPGPLEPAPPLAIPRFCDPLTLIGFARRSRSPPFRRAGAWFHVAARGGAGAADVALFPFRFPRRRDPDLHGETGGAVGARGARAHLARLGHRRDRLCRLS